MSELLNTNCPHCGAGIQVNPEFKDQLVCRYCGSSFMVKDVITNYNYTTINNYNDVSQSTHEGIMGKRKVILDEIEKEKNYFLKEEDLYKSVESLKREIPLCEAKKRRECDSISWINNVGIIINIVAVLLNIMFFFMAFAASSYWIGFFISLLILAGGIVISVSYNKKKDKIIAFYDDNKKILKERIAKLEKELRDYYNAYGTSLIGYEYTFPDKINKIYNLISSGRAETPKDAIDIVANEESSPYALVDSLISKYSLAEFNKMVNEYREKTGCDVQTAAVTINRRIYTLN